MILTAHQPSYLPWLGLFDKIARADTFVSFNRAQYEPKAFQNRNKIKTPQGPIWLTVPVLRRGYRDKPLNEIRINNQEPWRRRHWNTIEQNYRRAPYFNDYARVLHPIYQREWETLAELNETMLQMFLGLLRIKTRFLYADDFVFEGKKSDLVLDMCRKLGATSYIFGGEGHKYADVEAFRAAGVEPVFQQYEHPVYPQQHGAFISNMSVLDLLLNCGPSSTAILRNQGWAGPGESGPGGGMACLPSSS